MSEAMAVQQLKEKKNMFVESVNKDIINGLLDDLLESGMITQEKMEELRDENVTTMDKALALIEYVIWKGPEACQLLIKSIWHRDPHLARKMNLPYSNQDLKEKRKLFVQFVNKGTINCLLDDLLQANVFNQEEFEQIQKENDTSMDKARVLIDYVIRKGPKASEILIKSIWNRDPHLGHNLKLPYSASTAQTGSSGKLKVCSREEFLMQRRLRVEEIYPVMEKGSRTRLALIICNKKFENISERHGAEIDTIGMKTLLEDLDYNVYVKENLTSLEMESALKEFASHPDHQLSDSTFVVLMSHGVRHGICGIKHKNEDPDVFLYETMYEILNTRNCPNLKDKPKIIIVQACRGDNYGEVWVNDSSASCADSPKELQVFDHDAVSRAHSEKDFIAFHSSTPNNVSWRHPRNGSVFITKLIHYFQQYCWCYHIEEIFRKVQNAFETPEYKFQMPTIERLSMTRYFYLFPGN